MNSYFLVLMVVLLTGISQVLFKKAVLEKKLISKYVWYITGIVCLLFVTLLSVYCLRLIELKNFVAWTSSSYVLVIILSSFFLKEPIDRYKIIGIFLIVSGILIFQLL